MWWSGLVAGLLALGLYAATLAPGLTWAHSGADGGDLLAAALTHGVPHPPGYPTYQLLLRAAIALYPGEPAAAGNWLSALCAAAAVGLLTDLVRRACASVTDPSIKANGNLWRELVPLAAGLTWAASPTLWGQAVITEVYTLHALGVVLLLWLLWRWREAIRSGANPLPWLAGAGLVFGLGMGNHLSLALLLPGAAVWFWSNRPLIRSNRQLLPWRRMGRAALVVLGCTLLGLTTYLYLPLAASGNPPVNWGNPCTPERLWWLVSGRIYQGLVFGVSLSSLPGRLSAWVAEALRQFGGPWGALLAFTGLWRFDLRDHPWWRLTGLVALAYSVYAIGYKTADSYVYLIPVWAAGALWLAEGLRAVIGRVMSVQRGRQAVQLAVVVALAALPLASVLRYWDEMDLRGDQQAREFVEAVLAQAEPGAVILTATDEPTFALWYALYGLGRRPDLIPLNVNLYVYPWYQETLAAWHPALVEITGNPHLPWLGELLQRVVALRPVYRAEPLNLILPGYQEQAEGVLVRLWPAR